MTESVSLTKIYVLGPREAGGSVPRVQPLRGLESVVETMRNRYVRRPLHSSMEASDFESVSTLMRTVPACRLIAAQDATRLDSFCELILEDFGRTGSELQCIA